MKYAAKVDRNQSEIVKALRAIGAQVVCTSTVGQGFPDLVVNFRGRTLLLELKDGAKPPSDRQLTPAQKIFHAEWSGEIHIVESVEQAIAVVCNARVTA